MLPEVRKYVESVEASLTARRASMDAAHEKYPKRHGYGEDARRQEIAYNEEVNNAYATCSNVQADAWSALKASGDPLVRWIAENCADYPVEARCVLSALPATVAELDDLAGKMDWCHVWNDFRQQALDAGVMPGIKPPSPAMKAVFERIDRENCCPMSRGARQRIGEALDALVQETLTSADSATEARTAKAPA
ncbi:hypothetical protein [Streptomyces malaysiensis]|uniref:Uncharacterized protein n=1 Tax=Streptomyces malaysiensis subsp. samsunensis TaxID=459658 RepID=A0A9X2M6R4_STRMQ|nr:hypothetical protein [Streptomyces samsunensis]MCQ8836093.1 hypothetical protein [Streptomyces samsunensis]